MTYHRKARQYCLQEQILTSIDNRVHAPGDQNWYRRKMWRSSQQRCRLIEYWWRQRVLSLLLLTLDVIKACPNRISLCLIRRGNRRHFPCIAWLLPSQIRTVRRRSCVRCRRGRSHSENEHLIAFRTGMIIAEIMISGWSHVFEIWNKKSVFIEFGGCYLLPRQDLTQ